MNNDILETEINLINSELEIVKNVFLETVNLIPLFDIADSKVLPYGLKPHTRSISWIAEQVIAQQAKLNAGKLGITDVDIDFPDADVIDCVIVKGANRYPVNIKIFQIPSSNSINDIASLTRLYEFYNEGISNRISYVCFGFEFDNVSVKLSTDVNNLIVFSPQLADKFYINLGNNKIQFKYKHPTTERTRNEFLEILKPEYDALIKLQNERKEARKNAKPK
ncbi:MAG: hypothetical protein LH472_11425 [Pyrinomonadaceae bacterium]|nr:hypothetical protein [Pyrinomonadaceae bacterium]